jgi:Tol biopolymer transport system component
MELRKGGDSFDWFFLAMAHEKLGDKEKARQWYDRATRWMDKNQPTNEELASFRAEAAQLLGVDNLLADAWRQLDRKFVAHGQRSGWSPDGKKIVFGRSGTDNGILIHDIATNTTTPLTTAGKDPAWAGKDGRWIAYVTGSGTAEIIWAAEVPGGKPFRLAAGCMPSWSADGKTLFFQAFDRNQLMATKISGRGQFSPPRLRSAVPYRYPAISPDGKRVAYPSGADLVIQQMDDGKVLKRFVLPQGYGMLGGWSPDSREFGFGGWGADDPMPCIILDVETGLARLIAFGSLTFPAWSPDGTKITFDLRLRTGTEIWIIDAEAIKKLPTFKMETR